MAVEIDVWRIDLEAMPALDSLDLSPLDRAERSRLQAFLQPAPARRFALCRLALRHLLGGVVDIALGPHGKPYCPAPGAPRFNVSHASRLALIAISHATEVGIDIEPASSFADTGALQARICSPAERQWLAAHPDRADAVFGRLWTRKEALLKALGTGLALAPATLDLSVQIDAEEGALDAPMSAAPETPLLRWQALPPWGDHVAAVAARVERDAGPLTLNVRSFEAARLLPGGQCRELEIR